MSTPDSRDDVRAAIADLSKTETNDAGESAPETDAAATPAPVEPVRDSGADRLADGDDSAAATTDDGKAAGRVRGPDGKFVKGSGTKPPEAAKPTETKAPAAVAEAAKTPAPTAPVTTPTFKAPQSWKADVREKFNALPPEVQAEVIRRETETAQLLQSSAPAKRIHEAVAPFEAAFKASGTDVAQALPGILQTVQRLASGPIEDRAAILGNMVRSYLGGDPKAIELLARHIDSAPAAQQPQPQQVDPRAIAAQVQRHIQQQAEEAQVQTIAQQFEAEPREFLADVEPVMAALITSARARGEPPTLKLVTEAYEQACWATPSVRKVLEQRSQQSVAKSAQDAAAKARAAAVSVRPAPVVAPVRESGGSTRDDVKAVIADLQGRV